jgi:hypothetical protein
MRSESNFANRYAKAPYRNDASRRGQRRPSFLPIASFVWAFSSNGADVDAERAVRAARFAAVPRIADNRGGGVGDGWLGLLAIHGRRSGSTTTRVGRTPV